MILDFTKLFPQSCALKGIQSFDVNLDDIVFAKRLFKPKIGFKGEDTTEDIIQFKNMTYRFPSIDSGLFTLHELISARNFMLAYEDAKSLKNIDMELLELEHEVNKRFIARCTMLFGTNSKLGISGT